ncbi:hypothetical protein JCM8097_006590 [Rhodosporidiobolus ruineniae]
MSSPTPPGSSSSWTIKAIELLSWPMRRLPPSLRRYGLVVVSVFILLPVVSTTTLGSVYELIKVLGVFDGLTTSLACIVAAWLQRGTQITASQRTSFALQLEVHKSINRLIRSANRLKDARNCCAGAAGALELELGADVPNPTERAAFEAELRPSYELYLQVLQLEPESLLSALTYLDYECAMPADRGLPIPAALRAATRSFYLNSLSADLLRRVAAGHWDRTLALHRHCLTFGAMLVFSPSTASRWAQDSLNSPDPPRSERRASDCTSVSPEEIAALRSKLEGPLKLWLDEIDRVVDNFNLVLRVPLFSAHKPFKALCEAEYDVVEAEQAVLDAVLDAVLTRSEVRRILRERVLEERARKKRTRARK